MLNYLKFFYNFNNLFFLSKNNKNIDYCISFFFYIINNIYIINQYKMIYNNYKRII
jgi:hypothetical protein